MTPYLSTHEHARRWDASYEWIKGFMPCRILDLGSASPFRKLLTGVVTGTDGYDLRERLPYADESFDLVLCMEVLEHLKDPVTAERATFHDYGVSVMLQEVHRMLRPTGHFFLTTPNLACWYSVHKLLCEDDPYFFPPHVRERTHRHVAATLLAARFKIERMQTIDVWNRHNIPEDRVERLRTMLSAGGYNIDSRQDCSFFLCTR